MKSTLLLWWKHVFIMQKSTSSVPFWWIVQDSNICWKLSNKISYIHWSLKHTSKCIWFLLENVKVLYYIMVSIKIHLKECVYANSFDICIPVFYLIPISSKSALYSMKHFPLFFLFSTSKFSKNYIYFMLVKKSRWRWEIFMISIR